MRIFLLTVVIAVVGCTLDCDAQPPTPDRFVPGRVGICVKPGSIFIPRGIDGLKFDVVSDSVQKAESPKWRFLGPLLIESMAKDGSYVAVTHRSQLEGISTTVRGLLVSMSKLQAWLLMKESPSAVPGDTTFWDSVTNTNKSFPDMSGYFEISFVADISLDSAVRLLERVPGVLMAGKLPVPQPD